MHARRFEATDVAYQSMDYMFVELNVEACLMCVYT